MPNANELNALDPEGSELPPFAAHAGMSLDAVVSGRDLGDQGVVSPEDAQALLAELPLASRQLLARTAALYLVLEEIPPMSLAPTLAPLAAPLVAAGLVTPASASDQQYFNRDEWGVTPDGLLALDRTIRLIGFVTALLAGESQDGRALYYEAMDDFGRFRVFP